VSLNINGATAVPATRDGVPVPPLSLPVPPTESQMMEMQNDSQQIVQQIESTNFQNDNGLSTHNFQNNNAATTLPFPDPPQIADVSAQDLTANQGPSSLSLPFSTLTSGRKRVLEKTSVFQAHVCCITDQKQVSPVLQIMQQDSKFRKVSNWIYVYRVNTGGISASKPSQILEGYQDSPQTRGAGAKLLHLLGHQTLKLENLLLVVTQWDGGVPGKLGGVLFHHVLGLSKDLLLELKKAVMDSHPGRQDMFV
jgi:hypothetical protein